MLWDYSLLAYSIQSALIFGCSILIGFSTALYNIAHSCSILPFQCPLLALYWGGWTSYTFHTCHTFHAVGSPSLLVILVLNVIGVHVYSCFAFTGCWLFVKVHWHKCSFSSVKNLLKSVDWQDWTNLFLQFSIVLTARLSNNWYANRKIWGAFICLPIFLHIAYSYST